MNGVRINTLDIGGPYSQATGPTRASLQKIYTCGHLTGGPHADVRTPHRHRLRAPRVPPAR